MQNKELQRILFESYKENKSHLVITDFNVMVWKIIDYFNSHQYRFRKKGNLEVLLKIAIAYYFNKGPEELTHKRSRNIVIADKYKDEWGGYWRHFAVEQNKELMDDVWNSFKPKRKLRAYKDGRGEKTEFFYFVFETARKYCQQYLSYYEFEGFEADDIAGVIYRNLPKSESRIKIFYTVDRDWGQLVKEEEGFYWYTPRIPRPNEWCVEQIMSNEDVRVYAEKRLETIISHPSELVIAKVNAGDLGDNLPPGSPAYLMDLINPHPDFQIEKVEELINDCSIDEPNVNLDHLDECFHLFSSLSLPIPTK